MSPSTIRKQRLCNQQISSSQFSKPDEIVNWFVAMQAQEFAHAKWAIGLRLAGATNEVVEKAFNDGAILRTHLMRPTWHFVSPQDIRWLLALTAPRVQAINAYSYKKLELSPSTLTRSINVLVTALEGGKHLTRANLSDLLKKKKILADGLRLGYIMMNAELEGIICSGPRIGKQFTYALLDERAPGLNALKRDEALSMFMIRYFTTRGPATLQDFTNWSGLTLQEAKAGLASIKKKVVTIAIDNKEYFTVDWDSGNWIDGRDTFLMPDYDEYAMSYKDRSALFHTATEKLVPRNEKQSGYHHWLVVDGVIQGSWKSEDKKDSISITTTFVKTLTKVAQKKVSQALKRYCTFFGKKLQVHTRTLK